MCSVRLQHWVIVGTLVLTLTSVGCRNRAQYCQPGCYTTNPFGGIAGNTAVPAPATYSLQIPGNQNPQYYNGNATAQQLPPLQPTGTLPPAQGNVQSGWQPAGTGSASGSLPVSTGPPSNGTTQSQSLNAGLVSVADRGDRVAQNTTQPGGLSRTDNTNFRTTAVDERLDRSRLPVTDASQVRAPTSFSPSTTVGQFNTPYYVPDQNINQYPHPYGNVAGALAQPANPNYAGNRPTVVQGNFAQPTFAQPSQQVYRGLTTQNPQILAQSTVYADPANDPNFQNGWRDRELTASRDSLSR